MEQMYWSDWARTLQRKKMTGFALTLMDGGGPAKIFLSQVILAFLPFMNRDSHLSWKAFAEMLEDPSGSKEFEAYLRQEKVI